MLKIYALLVILFVWWIWWILRPAEEQRNELPVSNVVANEPNTQAEQFVDRGDMRDISDAYSIVTTRRYTPSMIQPKPRYINLDSSLVSGLVF